MKKKFRQSFQSFPTALHICDDGFVPRNSIKQEVSLHFFMNDRTLFTHLSMKFRLRLGSAPVGSDKSEPGSFARAPSPLYSLDEALPSVSNPAPQLRDAFSIIADSLSSSS